jgi:hypothetical protein
MNEAHKLLEEDDKRTLLAMVLFMAANAVVFISFSGLWAWEYHFSAHLSDLIDHITVPWGWLGCFFVVSISTVRRVWPRTFIRCVFSAVTAAVLSFYLWIFINTMLAPLCDPNW